MSFISPEALENARSETMGLMLAQLKTVARGYQLPVSGAKATLQNRIKESQSCRRVPYVLHSYAPIQCYKHAMRVFSTLSLILLYHLISNANPYLDLELGECARNHDIRGFSRLNALISEPDNPATPDRDSSKYLSASAPARVYSNTSTMGSAPRPPHYFGMPASSSSHVPGKHTSQLVFLELLTDIISIPKFHR